MAGLPSRHSLCPHHGVLQTCWGFISSAEWAVGKVAEHFCASSNPKVCHSWLICWLQTVAPILEIRLSKEFFLSLCVPVTFFSFTFTICVEIDTRVASSYFQILFLAFTEEVPNICLLPVFEGISRSLWHFKKDELTVPPYSSYRIHKHMPSGLWNYSYSNSCGSL